MKIFALIVLILLLAGGIVYADGTHLPVNHTVSVTGVVAAPPEKVFTLITNVAKGSDWRPAVKSVTLLQPDQGRDHWVEHLDHGQFMTFLAVRTDPPTRREVLLDEPHASYGGTWIYELSPGPALGTTTLKITETGFIRPPLYRFIMAHVFGPTHNLDQYMKDIQSAAKS
jgi:uncharacterized protein YndB with AHSA1/START domain